MAEVARWNRENRLTTRVTKRITSVALDGSTMIMPPSLVLGWPVQFTVGRHQLATFFAELLEKKRGFTPAAKHSGAETSIAAVGGVT
jgi:hypothetical protein